MRYVLLVAVAAITLAGCDDKTVAQSQWLHPTLGTSNSDWDALSGHPGTRCSPTSSTRSLRETSEMINQDLVAMLRQALVAAEKGALTDMVGVGMGETSRMQMLQVKPERVPEILGELVLLQTALSSIAITQRVQAQQKGPIARVGQLPPDLEAKLREQMK